MLLGGTRNDNGLFEWLDGSLVRDTYASIYILNKVTVLICVYANMYSRVNVKYFSVKILYRFENFAKAKPQNIGLKFATG